MGKLDLLLLSLCFLMIGCNLLDANKSRYSYDVLYVDHVEVPDTLHLAQPLKVRVKGTMPDVSWSFDHFEIKAEGFNISIRPIGRKDNEMEMVILILATFDETATIQLTQAGTYQVTLVGRDQDLKASVVVEP